MATVGRGARGTEPAGRWRGLIASALLLTLAQPPSPAGWLAYGALIPYLWALEGVRGKQALGLGMGWGLLVHVLGLYWIAVVNLAALAGAMIYLTLAWGFFTWLLCRLSAQRRLLLLPMLWTAFVWVLSLGQMGFPWLNLALTQTWSPAALQMASLTGSWGLEAWVAGVNALLYYGLVTVPAGRGRAGVARLARALLPGSALAIGVLAAGHLSMALGGAHRSGRAGPEGERPATARVAAIQGSIVPQVKLRRSMLDYNLYVYERLSRAAIASSTEPLDLIVWPETAVPQYLEGSPRLRRQVADFQQDLGVPLITGAFAATFLAEGGYNDYNAAFLVDSGSVSSGPQVYRKRLLVPFGERVPYQRVLGPLKGLSMGWSDFAQGEGAPLMQPSRGALADHPVGVVICYESMFTRLVRGQVRAGARLLVVITNDAWFGRTSGPYQHFGGAALRAVEYRRPVVRAANAGISGFIDRWGRAYGRTPLFEKTVTMGEVVPEGTLTWYARTGDWLPLLCLLMSVGLLLLPRAPGGSRVSRRPVK